MAVISMIRLLLTVGLIVLLLYVIRRVGGFTARTWVVILSGLVSMLIYDVLFTRLLGGGSLGLVFFGVVGGGISILIDNGIAKRSPRKADPQPSRPAPKKAPSAKATASIFISYRRDDSADVTGRIYDRLTEHFGKGRVFKDVDSIPLGVNFKQHLENAVMGCRLLLVVMGQRWSGREAGGGRSNITDPVDFVRIEIETAIQRSLPIIPVLVQGVRIPRPEDLPDSLRPLVYYSAIEVRPDPDFHSDVTRLITGIEGHLR